MIGERNAAAKEKEAQARLLEVQSNSEKAKQETANMKAKTKVELALMEDDRPEKSLMWGKRLLDAGAATQKQLVAMGLELPKLG